MSTVFSGIGKIGLIRGKIRPPKIGRPGDHFDGTTRAVHVYICLFYARTGRGPTVGEIPICKRRAELDAALVRLAQRGWIRHPGRKRGGEIVPYKTPGGQDYQNQGEVA